MITEEHTKEALSRAYVTALAGMAGLSISRPETDYGVDGTLHSIKKRNGELVQTGHPVDFQLKSTTRWRREKSHIVYDLDAKAHRNLTDREKGQSFFILILLCLPKDINRWMEGSESFLRLSHCCYWEQLSGPPTDHASSIRIRIPRVNILTANALQGIMSIARERAEAGL